VPVKMELDFAWSCSNLQRMLIKNSEHTFQEYAKNDISGDVASNIKDIILEDEVLADIKTQFIDIASKLAKMIYSVETEPDQKTVL